MEGCEGSMGEKNGETETERDRERMEIEKTITVF